MKKITLLFLSMGLTMTSVMAQTTSSTLRVGEFDPYVSEYFRPMAHAIAVSMGSGWVHTAETHKTLGFDITISGALVTIPNSESTFTSNDLSGMANDGYTFTQGSLSSADGDVITFPNVRRNNNSDLELPTIKKELSITANGTTYSGTINFEAIYGITAKYAANAAIQLGVGLPKGTDVMVRYFPDVSGAVNAVLPSSIDMEMLRTSYWGLGVKHDLKQWIPALKKVPFLQISAMFTYSNFKTGFKGDDLKLDPERFTGANNVNDLSGATYDDQELNMIISSTTGALLVGASIPVFQPYIGIGFNSGKFKAGLDGTYPILTMNTDPSTFTDYQFIVEEDGTEQDPLNVESTSTEFNIQMGARIKLGFFVLHYQYTRQKYNMHSGGIAITIR